VTGALPRNERIGIMTGSGGIGILMADAASELGMTLPPLAPEAADTLRALLPFAVPANPYDTTAQVTSVPDGVPRAVEVLLRPASGYGSVFAYLAHVGLSPERFRSTEERMVALRRDYPDQKLVLVMLSDEGVTRRLEAAGIAVFADPTRAVKAVAGSARMASLRATMRRDTLPPPDATHSLPDAATEAQAKALLGAAGIPVLPEQTCTSAADAARAADSMGYPVVAKIVSADIPHKTEVGGVIVGLLDAQAVATAYDTLLARAAERAPQARIDGVLVAPMVIGGVETIIGIHMDAVFGPMVMFGLGGTAVELFKDVAFASAPLTPTQGLALLDSVRSSTLLTGWRGGPKYDIQALAEALSRLSHFAVRHADRLAGIDINPFVVKTEGAVCLDALISTR
jgi:acyl-CoA synthetase (NDP forming)